MGRIAEQKDTIATKKKPFISIAIEKGVFFRKLIVIE